jgi:hypothetical protein
MDQIVPLNGIPLCGARIQRGHHVDGVPGYHRVRHEVQTARLIQLLLGVLPSDLAFIGKKEKPAQGMEGLARVELGVNAAPVLLTLQVMEDEDGFDQASVFLEGPGQRVLPWVRLQLTDEQGLRGGGEVE